MIVQARTRPVTSLRLLCDAAATHGIDAAACLEDTGITVEDLADPVSLHTTQQELQAIENYVRLAPGNVGLGWAVGQAMHVNAFGVWGFAILTSPTLRSAIQTSLDYIKLSFVIADMRLAEDGSRGGLVFDMTGLAPTVHRFLLERHSAVAVNFVRALVQRPDAADFRIETPESDQDYAARLSGISGIPVATGMQAHALTFDAELLDQPLPKSDPISLRFCLEQCKALAEQNDNALPPWSQKVRDAIIDDIGSDHKIEDISQRLTVTERTLRRRLTEEGTSFRELYTDIRMALAHELLETAGLNVETVAWRVGYAEPASFARAFAKKFGTTPGDVRRSNSRQVA